MCVTVVVLTFWFQIPSTDLKHRDHNPQDGTHGGIEIKQSHQEHQKPRAYNSGTTQNYSSQKATSGIFPPSWSISLTIRMTSTPKLLRFVFCDLLKSVALYWTRQLGDVAIILDQESTKDRILASTLQHHQEQIGMKFSFIYEPLPKDKNILNKMKRLKCKTFGYRRQLYSSFLMDRFINSSIIAWIDTDTKFKSPVTIETIFNGNKLRVKGINKFKFGYVQGFNRATKLMIGKPIPTNFMSFFPAYIWRDTITNCNKYILKFMKVRTIEEAFIKNDGLACVSPVNVFLTYAYYFEKDRYDWHIDIGRGISLKKYNKLYLLPGHELTPSDVNMDIHVTFHNKYFTDSKNVINRHGYCAAVDKTSIKLDTTTRDMCKKFQGEVMWSLFIHQNGHNHLDTWCGGTAKRRQCLMFINDYYKQVRTAVKDGVYKLDIDTVRAVDKAAVSMNVKCKPFFYGGK
ncbi:hypothetical protein SNE40_017317 [Patella caerulea]|uniref:Uncharacterized protein n=1 Tax=Patella caerulea TaxID=87958 RepID=A0AAN8PLC6_PATCE